MKSRHPTYLRRSGPCGRSMGLFDQSLTRVECLGDALSAIPSQGTPSIKVEKDGVTKEKSRTETGAVVGGVQEDFYRHLLFSG